MMIVHASTRTLFGLAAAAAIATGILGEECPEPGLLKVLTTCDYDELMDSVDTSSCPIELLFPQTPEEEKDDSGFRKELARICERAHIPFHRLKPGDKPNNFDKHYMDGGTEWNRPTAGDPVELQKDLSRINGLENVAGRSLIGWPDLQHYGGFDNFYQEDGGSCQYRAVMCCFIDNLDGSAVSGNADVCNHDLAASPTSNHVKGGWAVFDGSQQDSLYCEAFSWSADETSPSHRFRGNSLYHASFRNTLVKGLAENIPGAPMCGCIEQMPTVTKAACREVDVNNEEYVFHYDPEAGVTAKFSADVEHPDCRDFLQHYQSGDATDEEKAAVAEHLVGDCGIVNKAFMSERSNVPGKVTPPFRKDRWEQVVGAGWLYKPMVGDNEFRALFDASPNKIVRRFCHKCRNAHKDIFYKRLTPLPGHEELDFLDLFMNNWFDEPANTLNEDFALYSTYKDALAGTNAWTFCNFNDAGVGFPRDCGPKRKSSHQWNSYTKYSHLTTTHAFYVEKPVEK